MRTSTELIGVLLILVVGFGVMRYSTDGPIRAMLFALVITVGGGVMAFLRSRRAVNRR